MSAQHGSSAGSADPSATAAPADPGARRALRPHRFEPPPPPPSVCQRQGRRPAHRTHVDVDQSQQHAVPPTRSLSRATSRAFIHGPRSPGHPGRDQVAVDHAGLVHPVHAGVDHVVPDSVDAGRPPTLDDPGRDRHPPGVTDEGDRLGGGVERLAPARGPPSSDAACRGRSRRGSPARRSPSPRPRRRWCRPRPARGPSCRSRVVVEAGDRDLHPFLRNRWTGYSSSMSSNRSAASTSTRMSSVIEGVSTPSSGPRLVDDPHGARAGDEGALVPVVPAHPHERVESRR